MEKLPQPMDRVCVVRVLARCGMELCCLGHVPRAVSDARQSLRQGDFKEGAGLGCDAVYVPARDVWLGILSERHTWRGSTLFGCNVRFRGREMRAGCGTFRVGYAGTDHAGSRCGALLLADCG